MSTNLKNPAPQDPEGGSHTLDVRRIDSIQDAVIRFAGNSQDGIQTIGGFLARLAGRSAQEVMTYMTIPSTISGGPSIFQVHLGSGQVLSAGDDADFLVTFYQHSYDSHIGSLRDGGVCLYDKDEVVCDPENRRVEQVGAPITTTTIEAIGGSAKSRGKNMFVLGLVCQLFRLDREKLVKIIERQFGKKHESVLRTAMLAFDAGYAYPVGDVFSRVYDLGAGAAREGERVTTDGNTALTYGLLAGGVRYGAGYPITPWSSIMEVLRAELPKYGGMFVQAEDELAAVSATLGFAYAGHLAVTGSSGPGLSLKMEALSYASMAELPLVVINVQRGGPSTGLPTSVEQSDLLQAIYGSHGDSPRIVIAPRNVEDCFHTAVEACRLARAYSVPVIVLTDQALATRIEVMQEPHWSDVVFEPELDLADRPEQFQPYPLEGETRHAPPGSRMTSGKYPVVTGLEHDEWGHPSGSPALHQKMTIRRREKLKRLREDLPRPEVIGGEEGEILLVGWGSTYGPILEATRRARETGMSVSCMHLRYLHPLPPGLDEIMDGFEHVLVVEMNDEGLYGFGQLAMILRAAYANPRIRSITKTDGLTFKIREILAGASRLRET
ncbi:MAG TPA: 2-oxoacid:acceptor oxidoreductase subunit alpha [Verrucomicrobiales bacterium]|nr:2-oxoacid:acceptor oxidoreductase subunit alpha [Verrucomicrobiales bacterium]